MDFIIGRAIYYICARPSTLGPLRRQTRSAGVLGGMISRPLYALVVGAFFYPFPMASFQDLARSAAPPTTPPVDIYCHRYRIHVLSVSACDLTPLVACYVFLYARPSLFGRSLFYTLYAWSINDLQSAPIISISFCYVLRISIFSVFYHILHFHRLCIFTLRDCLLSGALLLFLPRQYGVLQILHFLLSLGRRLYSKRSPAPFRLPNMRYVLISARFRLVRPWF